MPVGDEEFMWWYAYVALMSLQCHPGNGNMVADPGRCVKAAQDCAVLADFMTQVRRSRWPLVQS
ncbi:MAG: hypothetical protein [Microvirus sp.]|nr:MAG: hypothetical protein [Microvirus sp.]